jgi:tetratricopeptide (TPR) repeat protein/O-antigen ligase
MVPEVSSWRGELERALSKGELLVASALIVMAPIVRGEIAYGNYHSIQPVTYFGEAYFLLMLGFLGIMVLLRKIVSGRAVVPEPASILLLGILAGYIALRGVFSDYSFEAGRESVAWLSNLLLFSLLLVVASARPTGRWLLSSVVASLAVQCVLTLHQTYHTLPALREGILSGANAGRFDSQNPAVLSRVMSDEPYSTFIHPNALACWLGSALFVAAGIGIIFLISLRRKGQASLQPGFSAEKTGRRILQGSLLFWIALLPMAGWALLVTGSKGAYLAMAFSLALCCLLVPLGSGKLRRAMRLLGGAALAGLFGVVLLYWFVPDLPGRAALAASVEVRVGYWKPAMKMASGNIFFGKGPGTFGVFYSQMKTFLSQETQSAHSAYLETLAEKGLLGLGLLLAFWGWVLLRMRWRVFNAGKTVCCAAATGTADGAILRRPGVSVFKDGVENAVVVGMAGALGMSIALKIGDVHLPPQIFLGMGLFWLACFLLGSAGLFVASKGKADAGSSGLQILDWCLLLALLVFLVHSAGSMGMSLRSLIGPALILAALGLAGPGRREWRLQGGKALLAAGVTAAATAACLWLGVNDWRRGNQLTDIQNARMGRTKIGAPLPTELECALRTEKSIAQAIAQDPLNWSLHLMGARNSRKTAFLDKKNRQFREGRLRDAEKYFRAAVLLAPDRTTTVGPLARFCAWWPPLHKEASSWYERLCSLYPLKGEYLLEWGDVEMLSGNHQRGEELYHRALEGSRRTGDEAIHLSIMFEHRNRLSRLEFMVEKLAKVLDELLEKSPDNVTLLFRRTIIEVARGVIKPGQASQHMAAARDFMKKAHQKNKQDAQILLFLGYCQRLAGEKKAALATFKQVAKLELTAPGSLQPGPGSVRRAIYRLHLEKKIEDLRGEISFGEDSE